MKVFHSLKSRLNTNSIWILKSPMRIEVQIVCIIRNRTVCEIGEIRRESCQKHHYNTRKEEHRKLTDGTYLSHNHYVTSIKMECLPENHLKKVNHSSVI